MYSTHRFFKLSYFMLLRSLQNINQSYIKCTENTLLIHSNDDDDIITVIIVAVTDNDSNLKIKKKLSFKWTRRLLIY